MLRGVCRPQHSFFGHLGMDNFFSEALERMTPEQRAEWIYTCFKPGDHILDEGSIIRAIALGVNWTKKHKIAILKLAENHFNLLENLLDPLINSGLDVNEADKNGRTALTEVCSRGRGARIVQRLIDKKAFLVPPKCLEVECGESPLEVASYFNRHKTMSQLIAAGAPLIVTRLGKEGHVLSRALESEAFTTEDYDEKCATIKILLDAGAWPFVGIDLSVKNGPELIKDGLAVLEEEGHQPSIELLKAAREKCRNDIVLGVDCARAPIKHVPVTIGKRTTLKL